MSQVAPTRGAEFAECRMEAGVCAILGGTFDPVHRGHLGAAIAAGKALGASRVTLLLAARPWHRAAPRASAADRWAMLRLGVEDANAGRLRERAAARCRQTPPRRDSVPTLEASAREPAGAGPSYTVSTLADIAGHEPLVWLLGDDALASIDTWHRADELAGLCHLLVFARSAPQRAPAPPAGFHRVASPAEFGHYPSGCIHYLNAAMVDVSATQVRTRIGRQEDASALLSPQVWAYIRRRGLYGAVRCAPPGRPGEVAGGAKSKRKI